jgi:adenylate cyclase
MPRKLLWYRLKTLIIISLIWILFGVVFFENLVSRSNDLGVQVSLFRFALIFGIIGFIITGTLIFFLKPAFNHLPLWLSLVIKLGITLLLYLVIAFVLLMIYYVLLYNGNFEQYLNSFFTKILITRTYIIFMVDMGLMTLLSMIFLEVSDSYGPGMFWNILVGEYHNPKIENRIFIFLDINESTTIAEKLGHEEYFRMLRRFYADLTLPVVANDGEIYQYVGDEIVVSWPNTPENKIKALKFIRNTHYLIERNRGKYLKRFTKVPNFKAGVHAGEVTVGFVGVIKRVLIYCGDTLNTTARIRSMCHDLNKPYILSEDFMMDFYQPHGYEIDPIGEIELRGRLEPTKLFSMKFE